MADILERLDALAPGDPPDDITKAFVDAAAEIRTLRAAIDKAVSELAEGAALHVQSGLHRHKAREILRGVREP